MINPDAKLSKKDLGFFDKLADNMNSRGRLRRNTFKLQMEFGMCLQAACVVADFANQCGKYPGDLTKDEANNLYALVIDQSIALLRQMPKEQYYEANQQIAEFCEELGATEEAAEELQFQIKMQRMREQRMKSPMQIVEEMAAEGRQ